MAMSHRQSMAQLHRAFGIVRIVPMTFGIVRIVAMTSFVSSLVSIDYFMRLGAAMRLMFGFWPVCIAAMTSFVSSLAATAATEETTDARRTVAAVHVAVHVFSTHYVVLSAVTLLITIMFGFGTAFMAATASFLSMFASSYLRQPQNQTRSCAHLRPAIFDAARIKRWPLR